MAPHARANVTTLAIWFFFGFVVHFFVTPLNQIVILGPLGFYMAARASLIAFVIDFLVRLSTKQDQRGVLT